MTTYITHQLRNTNFDGVSEAAEQGSEAIVANERLLQALCIKGAAVSSPIPSIDHGRELIFTASQASSDLDVEAMYYIK